MASCIRAPNRNTPVASDPIRASGKAWPTPSSITLGRLIVVRLKVSPPAKIARANSAISAQGRVTGITAAPPALRPPASPSPGTSARKASPQPRQTRPGTTKAARQPSVVARSAVTPEAEAAPKLPQTPLMPRSRPSRRAWVTSMAEPTG